MTKEQFKSYKKKIEQLQMQLYIFKQDFLYERDSESEFNDTIYDEDRLRLYDILDMFSNYEIIEEKEN